MYAATLDPRGNLTVTAAPYLGKTKLKWKNDQVYMELLWNRHRRLNASKRLQRAFCWSCCDMEQVNGCTHLIAPVFTPD